jgi:hypothetical protein
MDGSGSTRWSGSDNAWCAFYPDIPHRVNEVKSGYRAILNFKIFVKEPASQPWGENIKYVKNGK